MKENSFKAAKKYFLIAGLIVAFDQILKVIVKLNMEKGVAGQIHVIGDLFKIHFIENRGAAFGLTVPKLVKLFGGDMSETTGKLILSIFSIIAVAAIGYVLYKLATHKSPLPYFVALIFGGAMGNIIDRTFYGLFFSDINDYSGGLFYGRVVDMFYFDIGNVSLPDFMGGGYYHLWPIFNIADSAITVGIIVLLIFQGKFFKMDEEARGISGETSEAETAKEAEKKEEKTISPAEKPEADTPDDTHLTTK
ncbi:MAG: signal peptidase II [Bacteroidia bacterium]|nr:signal peptidase II [Bacteroidia bacterium]